MNWAFGSGLGQPINPQAMAQGQGLWSPEQLAQGFQLARGQGATLGNAQGMAQAQAEQQQNLAAMMEQYKRAQGDLERAAALQSPEYVQNSGALGALAMIAQAAAGRRLERKADERASDYAGRVFAEQQRMEQSAAAAQRAQAERDAARAREQTIATRTAEAQSMGLSGPAAAEYVATGKVPKVPDAIRTLEVLAERPDLAAIDRENRAAGAPRTNITMPGQNAFDRELGKADAQTYVQLRNRAGEAQQSLNQIANVEEILKLSETGKLQEAQAMIGQFLGSEQGANMQSLKMAIQPLVLAQVKQLGTGAGITDADRKFIEDGMPGFGVDPRANARGLRIMRQTANANISLFEAAESHRQQHGTLVGFNPATVLRSEAVSAPEQDAPTGPRSISTQAQYDALPSGALYVDPDDGKTYRKPQ